MGQVCCGGNDLTYLAGDNPQTTTNENGGSHQHSLVDTPTTGAAAQDSAFRDRHPSVEAAAAAATATAARQQQQQQRQSDSAESPLHLNSAASGSASASDSNDDIKNSNINPRRGSRDCEMRINGANNQNMAALAEDLRSATAATDNGDDDILSSFERERERRRSLRLGRRSQTSSLSSSMLASPLSPSNLLLNSGEGSGSPGGVGGGTGGTGGGGGGLTMSKLAMFSGTAPQRMRSLCRTVGAILRGASRELTSEESAALHVLLETLPSAVLEPESLQARQRIAALWMSVVPRPEFGEAFYKEFQKLSNNMQGALFASTDLRQQSRALSHMITRVLKLINDPLPLQNLLRCLGASHGLYGVDQKHFVFMGSALSRAIQQTVPPGKFNRDVQQEWNRVYNSLAQSMMMYSVEHAKVVDMSNKFRKKAVFLHLSNFGRHVQRIISAFSSRKMVARVAGSFGIGGIGGGGGAFGPSMMGGGGAGATTGAGARVPPPRRGSTTRPSQPQLKDGGNTGNVNDALTSNDRYVLLCEAWLHKCRPRDVGTDMGGTAAAAFIGSSAVVAAATASAIEALATFVTDSIEEAIQAEDADVVLQGAAALAPAMLMWTRVCCSQTTPDWEIVKNVATAFSAVFQLTPGGGGGGGGGAGGPSFAAAAYAAVASGGAVGVNGSGAAGGGGGGATGRTGGGGGGGAAATGAAAATGRSAATLAAAASAQQTADLIHSGSIDPHVAWVENLLSKGLMSGVKEIAAHCAHMPCAPPMAACRVGIEQLAGVRRSNPRRMTQLTATVRRVLAKCAARCHCHVPAGTAGTVAHCTTAAAVRGPPPPGSGGISGGISGSSAVPPSVVGSSVNVLGNASGDGAAAAGVDGASFTHSQSGGITVGGSSVSGGGASGNSGNPCDSCPDEDIIVLAVSASQIFAFAVDFAISLNALPAAAPLSSSGGSGGLEYAGAGNGFRDDLPRVSIAIHWCRFCLPVPRARAAAAYRFVGRSVNELMLLSAATAGGQILATDGAVRRLHMENAPTRMVAQWSPTVGGVSAQVAGAAAAAAAAAASSAAAGGGAGTILHGVPSWSPGGGSDSSSSRLLDMNPTKIEGAAFDMNCFSLVTPGDEAKATAHLPATSPSASSSSSASTSMGSMSLPAAHRLSSSLISNAHEPRPLIDDEDAAGGDRTGEERHAVHSIVLAALGRRRFPPPPQWLLQRLYNSMAGVQEDGDADLLSDFAASDATAKYVSSGYGSSVGGPGIYDFPDDDDDGVVPPHGGDLLGKLDRESHSNSRDS